MNAESVYYQYEHIFPIAFGLLPGRMDSPGGRAMMLAIGGQETEFNMRLQVGSGFAHGFYQFERKGGVTEVFTSPITKPILLPILDLLRVKATVEDCYAAIVYNDVLALVFARLLLWKYPGALPMQHEVRKGYEQYDAAWRPGAKRPEDWPANFEEGWRIVTPE